MLFCPQAEIYLLGAIDLSKEKERLTKELSLIQQVIARQEVKLANQDFIVRAPKEIVLAEKNKLDNYKKDQNKIENLIASL
jgi:valyl-tRNA synthetase